MSHRYRTVGIRDIELGTVYEIHFLVAEIDKDHVRDNNDIHEEDEEQDRRLPVEALAGFLFTQELEVGHYTFLFVVMRIV